MAWNFGDEVQFGGGGGGILLAVGAIVVERKYFTCPSRESNPGRWINRKTLYHVAVKAGFYRKAAEVCYIPSPVTFVYLCIYVYIFFVLLTIEIPCQRALN